MTLPGKTPQDVLKHVYKRFVGTARALKLSAKPVIAAVQGAAVGAGCEFAVACDFRIATPDALFWENWIELGIIPPLGGMFLLPRLIGAERAADMIMNSRRVSGEEALAWGMVSQIVPRPQFGEVVHKFAVKLARRAPQAMAVAKQGLRRGAESSIAAEWEYNMQAQAILLTSAQFAEAMAAFAEKRSPNF